MSYPCQPFKGWSMDATEIATAWVEDVVRVCRCEWMYGDVIRLLMNALDQREGVVPNSEKQKWIATAINIMSKYHLVNPIELSYLVYLSEDSYTAEQLIRTEMKMLKLVEWKIRDL